MHMTTGEMTIEARATELRQQMESTLAKAQKVGNLALAFRVQKALQRQLELEARLCGALPAARTRDANRG